MRNNNTLKITTMALGIAMNFIGGLIAISLKLPIYFDSLGTVITAFAFGPVAGIITGIISYIINWLVFDPCALYFIPAQILIGLISGILYKKGYFKKSKLVPVAIVIITIPVAFVSAMIATYVFGGVTSAGSTLIVALLGSNGVSMVLGVFVTQIFTDLLDKIILVYMALAIIKALPLDIKSRFTNVNSN